MMEVQRSASGGADLLMECDEEELEVWPQTPERDEEEEGCDEALTAAVSPMDEETDLPPVRVIPIPVQPVSGCSAPTHHNTLKSSGVALGFKVNGQLIHLLPGGDAAELKLRSHPGGSASGFTTVQIHSPAVNTAASLTTTCTTTTAADPTPVITGVVSGEAAQNVLTVHSVNLKSCPPLKELKTPSSALAPRGACPVNLSSPIAFISPWPFTLTSPWTLVSPLTSAPQTTTPARLTPTPQATPPASQGTLPAPQTTPPAPATTSPAPATTSPAPQTTTPAPLNLVPLTTPPVPQTTPPAPLSRTSGSQTTLPVSQTTHLVLLTTPPVPQTTPPAPLSRTSGSQTTLPVPQTKPPATSLAPLTMTPVPQTTPLVLQTIPPAPQATIPAPLIIPPVPKTTKLPAPSSSSISIRPAASQKPLHKGQLGPVSPPDCHVCRSQYKLITELRGFMCLCSPVIALGLKNLKKKKKSRKSRDKKKIYRDLQTSSKFSKTRLGPFAPRVVSPPPRTHRPPDAFVSERFTSPVTAQSPFTTCSPQKDQSEPPPPSLLPGKLVIMLEDFYYGTNSGQSAIKPNMLDRRYTGPYRCIHCLKTLRNNIKLMSHMKQHVSTMSLEDITDSQCPHCFRHFTCPFKLQCHLEAVHSQYQSTAKCKICELEFGSEASLLRHMKNTHKPGEMPYICQVCDFRSSFYSDVWSHFEEVHADTRDLMCQYCLRVMRSSTCYQQHFARHQKKHVFGCDKCRLHFLYVRERVEHRLNHRTHIRPPQLIGLKPGTKVTVRTYSVVGGRKEEEELKKVTTCKVVNVKSLPPKQEASKRKPVRSLGPLLSTISQESVSLPSQRCVECLSSVRDFEGHFPSLVHCSLCRFITCCSTSYANHMINNHATCRKNPPYLTIFQPEPRSCQRLRCVSCMFNTCKGDLMANHLMERPQHHCIILTHNGLRVHGCETHNQQSALNAHSVTSSPGQGGGAFIPIHLLPSGQTSTQLSVKPLTSPSPLSSPPAMTIKFLGTFPQPEKHPVSPLTASQLSVVLASLCHGLTQASRRFQTSPLEIRWWIGLQERRLSNRKWWWRTEKMAEWVLSQREQQLTVSEAVLLQTARKALGEDSELMDRYSWTVDFLLRHKLGLLPTNDNNNQHHQGGLPKSIRDNSHTFIHSLSTQIQSRCVPPHCVGSMDEFSIFINMGRFSKQNPSALQLFGSPKDKPVFDVVLSALSDGTFLPPLLFFRGTPSHVPEGFPDNVLLEARQKGFADHERLCIWIDKVWRPCVASQSNAESVLMADVYRGHLTDEFRDSLTSMSTSAVFIPPGCCCCLQPLDVCVTPVLRDFLQARWTQLVSDGGLEGLGLDQLALTLACWLSEVSSTLNSATHILRRSFASVRNLQHMEDRGEAVRMIAALTEALVQTPEASESAPDPEPQLELLLVMEEEGLEQNPEEVEQQMEQDTEEVEQQMEQDTEEVEQQQMEQDTEEVERQKEQDTEGQPVTKSLSTMHQVLDGESDQDSFHGFMED